MYRTLSDLQQTVNSLIEQHGPNASCAAFLFTPEDVNIQEEIDEEFVELCYDDLDSTYPGIVNHVLEELGDSDYMYEQMNEIIYQQVDAFRDNYRSVHQGEQS